MPEIVLIRGVPGSGKTTMAKTKFPNHVLCEADQFFTHLGTGMYKFDPAKLREAQRAVEMLLLPILSLVYGKCSPTLIWGFL